MSGNGPVRHDEFDRYVREMDHWRGEFDEWRRAHNEAHGKADGKQALEVRERRRWSWPEIVVAIITASGVIAAAAITAVGK